MATLSTWEQFIAAVNPFLNTPHPMDAMRKAGFSLSGVVEEAFKRVKPTIPPAPPGKSLGPPPLPIRINLVPPFVPPTPSSGFQAVVTTGLAGLDAVLQELWAVGTIPNQVSPDEVGQLFSLTDLSQLCSNVPTGSGYSLGGLQLTSPISASVSTVSPNNVHLVVDISLLILGPQPTSFDAQLQVELPLVFETFPDSKSKLRMRLAQDNSGVGAVVATLKVSTSSQIQPLSEQALATLEADFTQGVIDALRFLSIQGPLSFPVEYTNSNFPNTHWKLTEGYGATMRGRQEGFGAFGANLVSSNDINPPLLAAAITDFFPNNTHLAIHESFATDAVNLLVSSGDLTSYVIDFMTRHGIGIDPRATSGTVTFRNGQIAVNLDFVCPGFCGGFVDINFSLGLSGPPVISNGRLLIGAQYADISISAGDEIACLFVLGIWNPLAQLLIGEFGLVSGGDNAPTQGFPVTYSFTPLPGSLYDWIVSFQSATADQGFLSLDGAATMARDTTHIFVFLRLIHEVEPRITAPLANVNVTLLELDNPAPAGDDVVVPQTGTFTHVNPKFTVRDDVTYQPSPDQIFDTATTDENGLVEFVVIPNNIAGKVTDTQTITSNHDPNDSEESTSTYPVAEARPDFGITVVDQDGYVLANRILVSLNAPGQMVGTRQSPLVVIIPNRPIVNP